MPLYRVKSRVRFQGHPKKIKQGAGGKAQSKPTRTVFDAASQAPLSSNMVDEDLSKKKRVPSTEELGDLLKSNLSTSLAAEKAYFEQQRAQCSPPSPRRQHFEHVQEDDDDPPASLLELAPLAYAARDDPETTAQDAFAHETNAIDGEHSASSLATTAIYAPLTGRCDLEVLPRVSSTIPTGNIRSLYRASLEVASAADSCAIEDDDKDDAEWPQPTAPVPIRKGQLAFLKRVVTFFAGRRRRRASDKGSHEQTNHEESTTPLNSPPQPSVGSPCCSVFSDNATAATSVSSMPIRPPPPPRGTSYFTRTKARLNLPVSPPIIVPKAQRPHQPYDEGLSQPFIKPAPDHKLFGTYYVAPDIFTPEVVQQGFPGPPTRGPLTHPLPNEARFLDRTNTAWGKRYAKYPKPEDLPLAAAYKGAQEPTDQKVWDMHAAAHALFRTAPPPPTSEEEVQRRLDDEEHERAERLRYHTGHCFGALTGYCYPFQAGLIV